MAIKLKILFIFLILISGLKLCGQSTDYILTKEQNDNWFTKLSALPIDNKIDFIKTRILQDTMVYNSNQYRSDRIFIETIKKEEIRKNYGLNADGRILYFVRYKSRIFKKVKFMEFPCDNWTPATDIKNFHNFLNTDKINGIEIIKNDENEKAIFGSMAGFGVIIFDLNKRKYTKEFDKIKNKCYHN
jgi:hypothetical protein